MKNIGKFKSRKDWEAYLWEMVLKNIEKLSSKNELRSFLNALLSKTEKKNITRRLIVISLLKQGKTYKEISEILWISPGTISAVKKSLLNYKSYKSKHSLYRKDVIKKEILERMKEIPPETFFDYLAKIKWPKIAYTRKLNNDASL